MPAKTDSGVITASGGTVDFPNPDGAVHASFEELQTTGADAPATVSITVAGGMRGGTFDTASDTNTSVAAGAIKYVTFAKVYGVFRVTASWTGGTANTRVSVNMICGAN